MIRERRSLGNWGRSFWLLGWVVVVVVGVVVEVVEVVVVVVGKGGG